jgi:hypothetical protein
MYLDKLACLAPNTHNTQPWAFMNNENEAVITLFLDRKRVLPASDEKGRQSVISCGAALENMRIAAAYFGWMTNFTYDPINPEQVLPRELSTDKTRYVKLCRVSFEPASAEGSIKLYQAIFTRRMDRSMTDTSIKVPDEILKEIQNYESSDVGISLLPAGDKKIYGIAHAQGVADAVVANTKKFSEELGHWFQENDTQEFKGMTGSTFGMSDEAARHIKRGLLGLEKLRMDDLVAFYKSSEMGVSSAGAVCIVTVKRDIPTNWLEAGSILERIALNCESHGLNFAVHAGTSEVDLSNLGLNFAAGFKGRPVILGRFGSALPFLPKPPHSPRFPLSEVLITQAPPSAH